MIVMKQILKFHLLWLDGTVWNIQHVNLQYMQFSKMDLTHVQYSLRAEIFFINIYMYSSVVYIV